MEILLRLEINKLALDEEWVNQSRQVHDWCVAQADAQLIYDTAKNKLATVEATLELDIRQDPVAYGVDKLTEATVKAAVGSHKRYTAALEAVAKARYELAIASAAVEGLQHRKRALTSLVDLHLADYFSGTAGQRPGASTARPPRAPGIRRPEGEDRDADV